MEATSPETQPAPEAPEAPPSSLRSFLVVGLVALALVAVALGIVAFCLSDSSVLPMNYQGFDNK